ncbi:MAG: molybdenum cofactor biosynthesis protein B [Gammaproteobacteria bacterium]|nr:molybdenum cofactor biosynthesis protein B [Gammaproteobacteria bacterium]
MSDNREFISLNLAVLTISDSRTQADDTSGNTLVERARQAGHQVVAKTIVADDIYQIRAVISDWIAKPEVHGIITTGGTGVTGRDGTPEAVTPLLDKEIEGFGEMFRMISYEEIKTSALQSRAIAGVANATYLFCLPGSSGACRTGWDSIIKDQLDHRTAPCNLTMLIPRLLEK